MFDYTKRFDDEIETPIEEVSFDQEEVEEILEDEPAFEEKVEIVPEVDYSTDDLEGVATTRLFVRDDFNREAKEVKILSKGEKVKVVDEIDGWYQVETSDHKHGYCMSQYIELV